MVWRGMWERLEGRGGEETVVTGLVLREGWDASHRELGSAISTEVTNILPWPHHDNQGCSCSAGRSDGGEMEGLETAEGISCYELLLSYSTGYPILTFSNCLVVYSALILHIHIHHPRLYLATVLRSAVSSVSSKESSYGHYLVYGLLPACPLGHRIHSSCLMVYEGAVRNAGRRSFSCDGRWRLRSEFCQTTRMQVLGSVDRGPCQILTSDTSIGTTGFPLRVVRVGTLPTRRSALQQPKVKTTSTQGRLSNARCKRSIAKFQRPASTLPRPEDDFTSAVRIRGLGRQGLVCRMSSQILQTLRDEACDGASRCVGLGCGTRMAEMVSSPAREIVYCAQSPWNGELFKQPLLSRNV
ncbi:hypothetical protein C8F01DRAFT_471037 [Mycena amicta]|nr:hypothetical protein C8F01DRAFT_471037 [Mycena amicta]